MSMNPPSATTERTWRNHPMVRTLLVFSLFRAVYGMGILLVTYVLATGESVPAWTPWAFLAASMVFSRILFRWMKRTWPHWFDPNALRQ